MHPGCQPQQQGVLAAAASAAGQTVEGSAQLKMTAVGGVGSPQFFGGERLQGEGAAAVVAVPEQIGLAQDVHLIPGNRPTTEDHLDLSLSLNLSLNLVADEPVQPLEQVGRAGVEVAEFVDAVKDEHDGPVALGSGPAQAGQEFEQRRVGHAAQVAGHVAGHVQRERPTSVVEQDEVSLGQPPFGQVA